MYYIQHHDCGLCTIFHNYAKRNLSKEFNIMQIQSKNIINKEIRRTLQLADLLKKKSFFLFGPRGIGKSYLIRQQLTSPKTEAVVFLDLLDDRIFNRLSISATNIESIVKGDLGNRKIKPEKIWVVIDEVQKIPLLLDEVHRLIELYGWRFLLTGSSSRKLKQGGANLLGGRARSIQLNPLCYGEIETKDSDIERRLLYGALPFVYLSKEPEQELYAYRNLYIKEEIKAEALCRDIPKFSKFMEGAALCSGELINFEKIGRDYGISASTVREYYAILEETFMGFMLEPWIHSKKRKAISKSKFYLFDLGVFHSFLETKALNKHTDLFGRSLEHWIIQEVKAYIEYKCMLLKLGYWKSVNRQEVDLTIGEEIAVEIKSTEKASSKHLRGLKTLREENVFKHFYLVSCDPISTVQEDIHCLHCLEFLKRLWNKQII